MSLLAGIGGAARGGAEYAKDKRDQQWEAQKQQLIHDLNMELADKKFDQSVELEGMRDANQLKRDQRQMQEGIAMDAYKREQDNNTPGAVADRRYKNASAGLLEAQTNALNSGKDKNGKSLSTGSKDNFGKLTSQQKAAMESMKIMQDKYVSVDGYGNKEIKPFTEWNPQDAQNYEMWQSILGGYKYSPAAMSPEPKLENENDMVSRFLSGRNSAQ